MHSRAWWRRIHPRPPATWERCPTSSRLAQRRPREPLPTAVDWNRCWYHQNRELRSRKSKIHVELTDQTWRSHYLSASSSDLHSVAPLPLRPKRISNISSRTLINFQGKSLIICIFFFTSLAETWQHSIGIIWISQVIHKMPPKCNVENPKTIAIFLSLLVDWTRLN